MIIEHSFNKVGASFTLMNCRNKFLAWIHILTFSCFRRGYKIKRIRRSVLLLMLRFHVVFSLLFLLTSDITTRDMTSF